MAKWFVAAKRADFDRIGRRFHISPVLARIIRNRDMITDEEIDRFLNGTVADMADPFLLKDMDRAVAVLAGKIETGATMRVIGDYDVDGICATYILLRGLEVLGGAADTVIPHRIRDGYGLNDSLIEAAAREGIDTVITCDNGIAAAPQIAAAKALGMTVVVTDHHEVPYEETGEGERIFLLPPGDAVVDPKQEGCAYPYKQICGGVVAMKVIEALFVHMGRSMPPALLEELRCFAAMATVCDVMELTGENRMLVKYGLERMKETGNAGLRALMEVNGIGDKKLSPYHIGYVLGPCLNATGRLDTAERALTLFRAVDYREAVTAAADLKSMNESRKEMTAQGVAEAVAMVTGVTGDAAVDGVTASGLDQVLVLYLPDCHESLAGIIAGRIRERFGRPVFVLTKGEEDIKGSGRSIDAYHMYEEMSRCKDLFIKYGGHKLAAGLSMKEENIGVFRRRLNESAHLTEEDFEETVHIDVALPLSCVNRAFVKELERLEPFGPGNARPVFAQKNIRLIRGSIMGKNQNVGRYVIADPEGRTYEMVYFGDLNAFHAFLADQYSGEQVDQLYEQANLPYADTGKKGTPMEISMAYYPSLNSYRGQESIQIVMQHYC